MALSLTCDCGARFEVGDMLAGQEVPCPECAQPVSAVVRAAPPQPSLWALFALVLAIVGAFTIVGSVAAIIVGLIALLVIRSRPMLGGSTLALTAIGIGVAGAIVTGGLLYKPDLLPLGTWLRERMLAGQLDTSGPLTMASRSGDVQIDRPSRDWGRARRDRSDDPAVGEHQQKLDLLLVNVKRQAFVDVLRDMDSRATPKTYNLILTEQLNPYRPPLLGDPTRSQVGVGGAPASIGTTFPELLGDKPLPPIETLLGHEWEYEVKCGPSKWRFIVRVYGKPNRKSDPLHVIRAYTPSSRFAQNEKELRRMLDTVRIRSKPR